MTTPTEIKALEEAVKFFGGRQKLAESIRGVDDNTDKSLSVLEAAAAYLALLKGEHETDVIVKRKPTMEMILAGNDIRDGHNVADRSTRYIYEAMITASQEEKTNE